MSWCYSSVDKSGYLSPKFTFSDKWAQFDSTDQMNKDDSTTRIQKIPSAKSLIYVQCVASKRFYPIRLNHHEFQCTEQRTANSFNSWMDIFLLFNLLTIFLDLFTFVLLSNLLGYTDVDGDKFYSNYWMIQFIVWRRISCFYPTKFFHEIKFKQKKKMSESDYCYSFGLWLNFFLSSTIAIFAAWRMKENTGNWELKIFLFILRYFHFFCRVCIL